MVAAEDGGRWRAASAVLTVIGTVVLAAGSLRPIIESSVFTLRSLDPIWISGTAGSVWLRATVWVAVCTAVLSRRRILAVPVAWACVVAEYTLAMRAAEDLYFETRLSIRAGGWLCQDCD